MFAWQFFKNSYILFAKLYQFIDKNIQITSTEQNGGKNGERDITLVRKKIPIRDIITSDRRSVFVRVDRAQRNIAAKFIAPAANHPRARDESSTISIRETNVLVALGSVRRACTRRYSRKNRATLSRGSEGERSGLSTWVYNKVQIISTSYTYARGCISARARVRSSLMFRNFSRACRSIYRAIEDRLFGRCLSSRSRRRCPPAKILGAISARQNAHGKPTGARAAPPVDAEDRDHLAHDTRLNVFTCAEARVYTRCSVTTASSFKSGFSR